MMTPSSFGEKETSLRYERWIRSIIAITRRHHNVVVRHSVMSMMCAKLERRQRRNKSVHFFVVVVLSAALLGIAVYRFLRIEPTIFNIWMHCWSLIPSGLTLFWLSGRPVTVWTSRKLSDSAIEYGLMRNASLSKMYHTTSTHITLLHFVAINSGSLFDGTSWNVPSSAVKWPHVICCNLINWVSTVAVLSS